ncbi:MAG: hypothetical protein ABSG41_02700 [Bryobacteraceae bacterium]|jgi:hypothetical protein
MAKRSIEETFQAVKPKGRKGIPNPPTIGVGVASNNNDLSTSLSQAGQQIAQLQSAYQQQASLITANTQAIQGNTSAQSTHSAASVAGGVASSLFGGLGLLSPLISGIASLFGGSSTPATLPIYRPPSPVAIDATLNSATPSAAASGAATGSGAGASASTSQAAPTPQVTVNVTAMDSQSFMDHSTDIANAVREAMLNMHPINGVVASL